MTETVDGNGRRGDLCLLADLLRSTAHRHSDCFARPVAAAVRIDATVADATVNADVQQLVRAFAVLLQKGREHGGGVTTLRAWGDGDEIWVAIDDAGPGIPQQERQRVFENGADMRPASDGVDASALWRSLALARSHITSVGGSLTAEASPSGGARFLVRLPLARATAAVDG